MDPLPPTIRAQTNKLQYGDQPITTQSVTDDYANDFAREKEHGGGVAKDQYVAHTEDYMPDARRVAASGPRILSAGLQPAQAATQPQIPPSGGYPGFLDATMGGGGLSMPVAQVSDPGPIAPPPLTQSGPSAPSNGPGATLPSVVSPFSTEKQLQDASDAAMANATQSSITGAAALPSSKVTDAISMLAGDKSGSGLAKGIMLLAHIADAYGSGKAAFAGRDSPTMLQQQFKANLEVYRNAKQIENQLRSDLVRLPAEAQAEISKAAAQRRFDLIKEIGVRYGVFDLDRQLIQLQTYKNILNASADPRALLDVGQLVKAQGGASQEQQK